MELSGYGYGYGYGDGYGDGSGYGSGYGYGDGPYWANTISTFAAKWSAPAYARYTVLCNEGVKLAFWRSTEHGTAANGGSNAPVSAGTVEEVAGPLRNDCGQGQLHATLIPPKWKGERWWIVALHGDWRGNDEKMWGLKREILGECL